MSILHQLAAVLGQKFKKYDDCRIGHNNNQIGFFTSARRFFGIENFRNTLTRPSNRA